MPNTSIVDDGRTTNDRIVGNAERRDFYRAKHIIINNLSDIQSELRALRQEDEENRDEHCLNALRMIEKTITILKRTM